MSITNKTLVWFSKGVRNCVPQKWQEPTRDSKNRYQAPKLSAQKIVRIKKSIENSGQKYPLPEIQKKPNIVKYKGPKDAIKRQRRFDAIQEKLENMPSKIEEYYKNQREKRPHWDDPLYMLHHGVKPIRGGYRYRRRRNRR